MKILVAEDEPVSRLRIAKMLSEIGETELFETGKPALEAFVKNFDEGTPFDMLILDVSMPEMDGIELLKEVRSFEKKKNITKEDRTKVLMLTSYADKDTVIACYVAGCDDYAVKPFKKHVVIEKMQKMGFTPDAAPPTETELSISKMVADAIEGFKKGKVELPSLPFIVQELQDMMNSPNASSSEMAKIIKKDTAISINLIKAANSPYYGGVENIKDVKMAISRLGLDKTRSIVSEIANKGLYETKVPYIKPVMDLLWKHSFAVAHLSRHIAGKVWSVKEEQAFVKGLIHDVGATLLIKNIDDIIAKQKKDSAQKDMMENNQALVDELISSVIEVHASFGGTLFKTWNFGKDFVDVARLHEWDKFDDEIDNEVLVVNLADQLSVTMGHGFPAREASTDMENIQSAIILGIEASELTQICNAASKDIDEAINGMD
ncbi:putative Metal dependent phosphohydrolase [Desulfamplus magnetovallimortis]|uniref:Putative Metal dependent phosphohydrolase n=1 Tax=Desulfamplus magnetovallimortis TaxID=1246637 RepID=A0A1W1H5E2_9BACT|nr:HDOD domain-containing protein [Desulfamplus magnetovallimortis]SLM27672.1 putative Metal dependent phosphohydrolase [Desulfamplus magnetovallimortis]